MSVGQFFDNALAKDGKVALIFIAVLTIFWYLVLFVYPPWFLIENDDLIARSVCAFCISAVLFITHSIVNGLIVRIDKKPTNDDESAFTTNLTMGFFFSFGCIALTWLLIWIGCVDVESFGKFLKTYLIAAGILKGFTVIALVTGVVFSSKTSK